MSESCNHDCGSCSANCGERQEPQDFLKKPHELSCIRKVIGVVSGKGGVGKSMVTSMLATAAKRKGLNPAILDADITGPSIPKAFGITEKAQGDNLGIYPVYSKGGIPVMSVNLLLENDTDPVIWRGPVIGGVVEQFWTDVIWNDVDVMFIDMPPGTGDVPLTVFQSIPVDGIVIVTSPQELVSMIVEKAVNMAKSMNIPVLGIVENLSYFTCPDCGKNHSIFGESHIDETAEKFGVPVIAKLPIDPSIAALCDKGEVENIQGEITDTMSLFMESVLEEAKDLIKIAIPYENGQIFQHFGHSEQFKIYTIEGGSLTDSEVVSTNGSGHGALADFLSSQNIDVVISGNIGAGAKQALADAGIILYAGAEGDADEACAAFLAGALKFNPDTECDHHAHEHGEEGCGSGCGSCGGGCH